MKHWVKHLDMLNLKNIGTRRICKPSDANWEASGHAQFPKESNHSEQTIPKTHQSAPSTGHPLLAKAAAPDIHL